MCFCFLRPKRGGERKKRMEDAFRRLVFENSLSPFIPPTHLGGSFDKRRTPHCLYTHPRALKTFTEFPRTCDHSDLNTKVCGGVEKRGMDGVKETE